MINTPVDLIQATVQLEQPASPGRRTVGTGFLIAATNADGSPRTVLITANHVFASMKGEEIKVGYRATRPDGSWSYTPEPLRIRSAAGAPLWTAHPTQDVAAIAITAPPQFARAAIPMSYLATERDYAEHAIAPGDELFVLGFPEGLAANGWGFPILRSGRVASYPVSPSVSPTFLLDFAVFPGNSGGPVFATGVLQRASSTGQPRPLVAGMLTQQVEVGDQRLEIGIVIHARYIAETTDLLLGLPFGLQTASEAGLQGQGAAALVPTAPGRTPLLLEWAQGGFRWIAATVADLWRRLLGALEGPAPAHRSAPAAGAARAV